MTNDKKDKRMIDLATAIEVWTEGYYRLNRDVLGTELFEVGGIKGTCNTTINEEVKHSLYTTLAPGEAVARLRAAGFAKPHYLNIIADELEPTEAALQALNYRRGWIENLMVRGTDDLPPLDPYIEILPVTTQTEIDEINRLRGWDITVPQHVADPHVHFYYIKENDVPVAWGANAYASREAGYIGRIFTVPAQRRRGLAEMVTIHLMHAAARDGIAYYVLSATEEGHHLYQKLGFQELGYDIAYIGDGNFDAIM
jgi:ribosomal protein S18 acetylase RimI-like enzyme